MTSVISNFVFGDPWFGFLKVVVTVAQGWAIKR